MKTIAFRGTALAVAILIWLTACSAPTERQVVSGAQAYLVDGDASVDEGPSEMAVPEPVARLLDKAHEEGRALTGAEREQVIEYTSRDLLVGFDMGKRAFFSGGLCKVLSQRVVDLRAVFGDALVPFVSIGRLQAAFESMQALQIASCRYTSDADFVHFLELSQPTFDEFELLMADLQVAGSIVTIDAISELAVRDHRVACASDPNLPGCTPIGGLQITGTPRLAGPQFSVCSNRAHAIAQAICNNPLAQGGGGVPDAFPEPQGSIDSTTENGDPVITFTLEGSAGGQGSGGEGDGNGGGTGSDVDVDDGPGTSNTETTVDEDGNTTTTITTTSQDGSEVSSTSTTTNSEGQVTQTTQSVARTDDAGNTSTFHQVETPNADGTWSVETTRTTYDPQGQQVSSAHTKRTEHRWVNATLSASDVAQMRADMATARSRASQAATIADHAETWGIRLFMASAIWGGMYYGLAGAAAAAGPAASGLVWLAGALAGGAGAIVLLGLIALTGIAALFAIVGSKTWARESAAASQIEADLARAGVDSSRYSEECSGGGPMTALTNPGPLDGAGAIFSELLDACFCQAFGSGRVGDACSDPEERFRQLHCLTTPLGPTDGLNPMCFAAMEGTEFESHHELCQLVRCGDGETLFSSVDECSCRGFGVSRPAAGSNVCALIQCADGMVPVTANGICGCSPVVSEKGLSLREQDAQDALDIPVCPEGHFCGGVLGNIIVSPSDAPVTAPGVDPYDPRANQEEDDNILTGGGSSDGSRKLDKLIFPTGF